MNFALWCLAAAWLLTLVLAVGVVRGSRDLPRKPRRRRW